MIDYALNLLDLLLTLYALNRGVAEANPLMRCVPVMIAYKVFLVGALLWWLRTRREPLARKGLRVVTIFHAAVNVWHRIGIFLMEV